MNRKLQTKLFKKYPKLFRLRKASRLPIIFGIECGDGWFDLIDCLCRYIRFGIRYNNVPNVTVTQVKEKFGTLRFYFTGGDQGVDGAVSLAESLSGRICECCGNPGKTRNEHNWCTTLCNACFKLNQEERLKTLSS